ncbi:MAG: hypothetical protein KDA85_11680 [Planctomycetaceae bacterium]|nr:hypothetical protein [Planctomycetaceae bacterium]
MKKLSCFVVLGLAAMLCSAASAADVKSGLQIGDFPSAFNVTDITGPSAGEKLCYRCKYGARPVVSIFARKMDDNVAKLVSEIDGVVGKNADEKKMAAFVTLLTNDPDAAEGALKAAAEKGAIKHTPLTVFENNAGPAKYKIDANADVTVMMWVNNNVEVNHAFSAGQLNEDAIKKIVEDTGKILK